LDDVGKVDAASNCSPSINLPQNDFSMLHSLKIQNESQLHCNIWEIVKVNGNNQAIEFMQRNNCPGNIIVWPSCKTVERYPTELVKKQEAINFLLTTISNIVKCNTREAAECML
jgi:hypothetical protein